MLSISFFCDTASAGLIAGVDFEGTSQSVFDRTPDDYDVTDGVTVSTGSNSGADLYSGWTLVRTNGGSSANGNLRNDGGATGAGGTTPNFPARLEGNTRGSWSLNIADDVVLALDRIEFDVRGATNGQGRDGSFNTSLDGSNLLWENTNLPGRTSGGWTHVSIDLSGDLYQGLTDQMIAFNWMTPNAIDLDTIQVYGTAGPAAVPEPSTLALSMFGLVGLAWFACRKRK